MKRLLTTYALCFGLLASQAAALSCIRPDVAGSYANAAGSDQTYVVLLGRFQFADTTDGRHTLTPAPRSVTARFSGQALGQSGFAPTGIDTVTLSFTCVASWCGTLRADQPVLAFVERTADGYLLTVDACHSWVFENPTADDIARVESCMSGRGCAPLDDPRRR